MTRAHLKVLMGEYHSVKEALGVLERVEPAPSHSPMPQRQYRAGHRMTCCIEGVEAARSCSAMPQRQRRRRPRNSRTTCIVETIEAAQSCTSEASRWMAKGGDDTSKRQASHQSSSTTILFGDRPLGTGLSTAYLSVVASSTAWNWGSPLLIRDVGKSESPSGTRV